MIEPGASHAFGPSTDQKEVESKILILAIQLGDMSLKDWYNPSTANFSLQEVLHDLLIPKVLILSLLFIHCFDPRQCKILMIAEIEVIS